jgi:hypothetical protein
MILTTLSHKPILDRKFQSSLSMPLSMIETIDKCKGPMVTRSRYVVSLLEKALKEELDKQLKEPVSK